jgi:hypothetical protein
LLAEEELKQFFVKYKKNFISLVDEYVLMKKVQLNLMMEEQAVMLDRHHWECQLWNGVPDLDHLLARHAKEKAEMMKSVDVEKGMMEKAFTKKLIVWYHNQF